METETFRAMSIFLTAEERLEAMPSISLGRAIAVMKSVKEPASEGRAENQYSRHDEKYSADSCLRVAHDSLQIEGPQDEDGKVRNDEQYYAKGKYDMINPLDHIHRMKSFSNLCEGQDPASVYQ